MLTDSTERMKLATFLARSGEPDRARFVFTQITEDDPCNYQAWLWLSELSTDLEEQAADLEQAMKYVPAGEDGCKDLQPLLNELRGCIALAAPALPPAPSLALLPDAPELAPESEPASQSKPGLPPAAVDPDNADWHIAMREAQLDFGDVPTAQKRGSPIVSFARSLFARLF